MGVEFLLDQSKKEIERLDKTLKDLGLVKKQDQKSKFLKRFVIEIIRAKHHARHVEKHELDKLAFQPVNIKPARRQVTYFKPHEIHKMARLPERRKYFTVSEHEYPLLKAGNYTLVRAVVNGDYKIIEPMLTEFDLKLINDIKSRGIRTDEGMKARIMALTTSIGNLSDDYVEKIKYYINRDNRLGKIAMMLRDERLKTINCPGQNQIVRVIYNGRDLETDIMYHSKEEINDVVKGLANLAGAIVDENEPILDAVLANGTRVQGVLGNQILTPKFVISR